MSLEGSLVWEVFCSLLCTNPAFFHSQAFIGLFPHCTHYRSAHTPLITPVNLNYKTSLWPLICIQSQPVLLENTENFHQLGYPLEPQHGLPQVIKPYLGSYIFSDRKWEKNSIYNQFHKLICVFFLSQSPSSPHRDSTKIGKKSSFSSPFSLCQISYPSPK